MLQHKSLTDTRTHATSSRTCSPPLPLAQGQQEEFLSTLGAPRSTLSPWTHPHLSAFKELSFTIVCCPWCRRNHTEIRYLLQFYHTQRLAHPCCSGTLLFQPFSIPYSAFILARKKRNALKLPKCSFHPPHTTTTFLKASLSSLCQTSMSHRDIWLQPCWVNVLCQQST